MSKRRKTHELNLGQFQDPGKDLFAFLFLMVMVFSFMVLVSAKASYNQKRIIKKDRPLISKHEKISSNKLGKLIKKNSRIYIAFENKIYDPIHDLQKMENQGKVYNKGKSNEKIIYIERNNSCDILLEEYLDTFKKLSQKGVGIAFSERY